MLKLLIITLLSLHLTEQSREDTLLNVFLAIAVDNLANAQELTAAEEQAAEQREKVNLRISITDCSTFISKKNIDYNELQQIKLKCALCGDAIGAGTMLTLCW